MNDFTRSFPLEDIQIRSGGDGRTVEAYAAVFGQEVPISDGDGQYLERIDPTAFNKTLADKGTRFSVLYNHGMTIYGTPSDSGSMPIGTPLEVRADARGLLTVTRYNRNRLAEEALEAIREGSITAQSFAGRFMRSDKVKPRSGFRPDASGALQVVTRQEINLREYGPTPFPAYSEAAIVGVRSDTALASLILDSLTDPTRSAMLAVVLHGNAQARSVVAELLDTAEDEDSRASLTSLATRLDGDAPGGSATPSGAGTDEPPTGHSGRLSMSQRTRQILSAMHPEGETHASQ